MTLTHYEQTLALFHEVQDDVITFGHHAIVDIVEGKTIRQMSIDLCGNQGLEDKIGRWVMAAEWDSLIQKGPGKLYEDARSWLTPSHFTILYRICKFADFETARDLMEECLIRNVRKQVTEVRPVQWLMGKLKDPALPSTQELYHKLWKLSARTLADAQGEVERKGRTATRADHDRVRVLKLNVKVFGAV